MIHVGITGGDGYAAGELIRLLINHPDTEIAFVHSTRHAGRRVDNLHPGLKSETDLAFTAQLPAEEADVLFLCDRRTGSGRQATARDLPPGLRLIDLSPDFRLAPADEGFVYGLPELNRRATCQALHTACPGPLATCVLLGLLPLAKNMLLGTDVTAFVLTAATETAETRPQAGRYDWRTDNAAVYQAFVHPECEEVTRVLQSTQLSFQSSVHLVPCHGNFARGIYATLLTHTRVALDEIVPLYRDYYARDSFTHLSPDPVDLKQVAGTNKCLLHLQKDGDRLLVTSAIDNLLKGSAGQAVHNMNLMFNLEETTGLRLKATAF